MARNRYEFAVALDDFLGIYRVVAHRNVDVSVAGGQLGDVRGYTVHDRIGDEQSAEIVESVAQRFPAPVFQSGAFQRMIEVIAQRSFRDGPVFQASVPSEKQWHRCVEDPLDLVVGNDPRNIGVSGANPGHDLGEVVGKFR